MGYGKRVQRARAERGWTQKELGRRAGVARETIGTIEREEFYPRPITQVEIARVLDLDPDELFSRNGDEPTAVNE